MVKSITFDSFSKYIFGVSRWYLWPPGRPISICTLLYINPGVLRRRWCRCPVINLRRSPRRPFCYRSRPITFLFFTSWFVSPVSLQAHRKSLRLVTASAQNYFHVRGSEGRPVSYKGGGVVLINQICTGPVVLHTVLSVWFIVLHKCRGHYLTQKDF